MELYDLWKPALLLFLAGLLAYPARATTGWLFWFGAITIVVGVLIAPTKVGAPLEQFMMLEEPITKRGTMMFFLGYMCIIGGILRLLFRSSQEKQ